MSLSDKVLIKKKFELNEDMFDDYARRYHFSTEQLPLLKEWKKEWMQVVDPCIGLIKIQPEDLESLSLESGKEWMIIMVTLGMKVDEFEDSFQKEGNLLGAYGIDCLSMMMLHHIYEQIPQILHENCGLWPGKYEFIGDKYPIESMPLFVDYIAQDCIKYNQAFALTPKKSVIFLSTMGPEQNSKVCDICSNCGNKSCLVYNQSARNYGEAQIFRERRII